MICTYYFIEIDRNWNYWSINCFPQQKKKSLPSEKKKKWSAILFCLIRLLPYLAPQTYLAPKKIKIVDNEKTILTNIFCYKIDIDKVYSALESH